MDDGEKIPTYWPAMLFVHALQRKFPIWAERQRNRQRERNLEKRPSLENLIADIQDEARRSEKANNNFGKSDATKALNVHGKQPAKKARGPCKTCGSNFHRTSNYLHNNFEKRAAWEKKTGKKWLSKDEYEKRKLNNDSDSALVFNSNNEIVELYPQIPKYTQVLPILPIRSTKAATTSFLPQKFSSEDVSIISKDRWLADSGADSMVTNNRSDFVEYKNQPLEISGAGGTTTSPGVGIVNLEVKLTNGTCRNIKLNNVRYMPQCPVKLFSLRKVISAGGSLHANKIMHLDSHNRLTELCEIDDQGFLVELKNDDLGVYLNTSKTNKKKDSLEIWHQRLAH